MRLPVAKFSRIQSQSVTTLLAKKKSLISEDLYASFDLFDDDSGHAVKDRHKNTPQFSSKRSQVPENKHQPQLGHETGQSALGTQVLMNELLNSVTDVDDESPVVNLRCKSGKKEKNRHRAFQQEEEKIVIDNTIHISTHKITQTEEELPSSAFKEPQLVYQNKHQKHHQQNHKDKAPSDQMRKDKPNSKVRFSSESSQPDFVSMGLEKVSLMFGDEAVLKDATFSVSTGERVGLVGPNGGGKVSAYN